MPGSMSLDDLKTDLTASLHDAADVFVNDGDMERLLNVAAQEFNRYRPRTLLGTLTAVLDQMAYPAPDDLYLFKSSLWGIAPVQRAKPWEKSWSGPMPRMTVVSGAAGRELHLTPAPTQAQLSALGSEVRFYYFGRHAVSATAAETTLDIADRSLLLLRAQAEAMNELVMRNMKKPVEMRDGLRSSPKNMTPSSWYKILIEQWEKQVERLAA